MMNKFFMTLMTLAFAVTITACGTTDAQVASAKTENSESITETQEVANATKEVSIEIQQDESESTKWSTMSSEEMYNLYDEVSPSIEEYVPEGYYELKCIQNVSYDYIAGDVEKTMKWDIYLYMNDGLIGTLIVNESGVYYDMYGCILDHINENYNVCIADDSINAAVYVYPSGDALDKYMAVIGEIN